MSLRTRLGLKRASLGIALALVSLASVIALGTHQLRTTISRQILDRDAEVLAAVVSVESLGAGSTDGLAHELEETAGQLTLALRLSRLCEGVVATRLFDDRGEFVAAVPTLVRERTLTPAEHAALSRLKPFSRYTPAARLSDEFLVPPDPSAAGGQSVPLLSVLIPIREPGSTNVLAAAELIRDGAGIARELTALDRNLARQALIVFIVGGGILSVGLGWAFRRLEAINRQLQSHVADLRRANQELALAAKTSALGAITAHVLHGLTSPLTGLQSYVAAHAGADEGWEDALRATQRMQTLIGEVVRALGEQTDGTQYQLPLAELAQVIAAKARPAAAATGVLFESQVTAKGALSNRDANLVLLILENLLTNAVQATPRSRTVRLRIHPCREGVVCEVADEGPGLPEAVGSDLFVPRRSTKPGGNGIGLALSQQLARHLGAVLELRRSTAAGCVFALVLPQSLLAKGDATSRPAGVALALALILGTSPQPAVADVLPWRWSNPAPHGANIADAAFAGGLYVQVGERGQIFTSTDGDSWTLRDSHTDRSLRGVTFLGGRMVVTGEQGTVLFSDHPTEFYLVELETTDWLESVAASPDSVVAVGDHGAVYTSTNAVTWTRSSTGYSTWLRSVAWGNPGFVAVGESGFIMNKPAGSSWRQRNSGVSQHLNRVAWIGDRYWAIGDGGVVLTSQNGSSWSAQSCGATQALFAAAGTSASQLVAGNSEVRLKEGGAWADELRASKPFPAPPWDYYSGLWDGASYWLGGATGLWIQGYKTNATGDTLWYEPNLSVHQWLWAVARTPDFYLAVGDRGTVMASDNGIDWDLDLVPDTVTNTVLLGVAGTTNLFVAVGSAGTILRSTNGVTWAVIEPRPTTNDLQGITAGPGLLLATGARGTLLTSPDGLAWTLEPPLAGAFLSSVEAFPGGFVATGDAGTLLTSPDGTHWTARSLATTNWLWRARSLGGILMVVGENGTLVTSPEGSEWTPRTSGTTEWLTDAAFVENTWFVVGTGGAVLASTNLTAWSNLGTLTRKSLFGAAAGNGQLLAVGVEGIILRSQIVPVRTPVQFLAYDRTAEHNVFLLGGQPDQSCLFERSPDFSAWFPSLELEFTDGTGTLLFLEPVIPDLDREFYRCRLVP
ncbi:MAG TPA: ATP-binding protein [Verrucomicrobiota bacterium]|nr:ATP-binding protein [Verrucomicrobiota bacterium]HNU53326.1 ATP-binding protein [Verrucomicrobiota bacterium]